jgi:tetratricopeptide (TPR) repeat protein
MKNILILISIIIISYLSLSCINTYGVIRGTDEKWESMWNDEYKPRIPLVKRFTPAFDKGRTLRTLAKYDLSNISQLDMATQSDIATQYLKLGEFEKAVAIFEQLAKQHPNEYKVIANLGTTYELLGKNKLALQYIRKGLQLNPKSHNGSEWIHEKILEYKVAIDKNPSYGEQHQILNLNKNYNQRIKDKQNAKPNKEMITSFVAQSIVYEVDAQLRTRIPFVPVSDKITYQLFKELATFTGNEFSTSLAYGYAHMATYYASDDNEVQEAEKLVKHFKKEILENYFEDYDAQKLGNLGHYIDTTDFADGVSGVNWYKSNACCYDNQGYSEEEETNSNHGEDEGFKIPTPLKWVLFMFAFIFFTVWLMIKKMPED